MLKNLFRTGDFFGHCLFFSAHFLLNVVQVTQKHSAQQPMCLSRNQLSLFKFPLNMRWTVLTDLAPIRYSNCSFCSNPPFCTNIQSKPPFLSRKLLMSYPWNMSQMSLSSDWLEFMVKSTFENLNRSF